jgi:glycosyltransferase involved in cell wall biosynthesis
MLLLSVQLAFTLFRKSSRGDRVLIVTNPAPVVLLVAFISRMKGLKCFTIVHDVFPENLVAAKLLKPGGSLYKLLRYIFNNAYRRMSALFVIGRDMKEVFERKLSRYRIQPDIYVIENWADTDDIIPESKNENPIVKSLGIGDKVIFQFAGNLGMVQGLMELCRIIKDIENPLIHFIFIGEGAVKKEMIQFIAAHNLRNVSMLDSFSRRHQQEFLNASDVGIVSLQNGMAGLGVPSKSYNILAAGKPILFIGNRESEIARMINENDVGWCYEINDTQQLLDFFNTFSSEDMLKLKAKGEKARELAVARYSKEIILDKYLNMTANEN